MSVPVKIRSAGLAALLSLTVVLGTALCMSAPALAAPPEAPETLAPLAPESDTAAATVLRGVIDPKAVILPVAPGTYQFLYKVGAECEGGSNVPAPPGKYFGLEAEPVSQPVTGLESGVEYSVCLQARNSKEEASAVSPVHFRTPEAPETLKVESVTSTSAQVTGVLNPNNKGEAGSYEFLYQAAGSECRGGGATPTAGVTAERKPVSTKVEGLTPGTEYTFCLLIRNEQGGVALGGRVTLTVAPAVSKGTPVAVGSSSATVEANVSPGGLPTGYHVEYVSEPQFKAHEWAEATDVPAPDALLAASATPASVREELVGLQPATLYHYRFVATSTLGTTHGPEMEFTTTGAAGPSTSALPDNRAYEWVSPPDLNGNIYEQERTVNHEEDIATPLPARASAAGNAVAFVGDPPGSGSGGSGSTGQGVGNQYLATRSASGWTSTDISPTGRANAFYEAFSPDLSLGYLDVTPQEPQLTEDAPEGKEVLYSRTTGDGGYHPFYTKGSLPANTQLFFTPRLGRGELGNPRFSGASGDGSHRLFEANGALTPLAEESPPTTEQNDLYDSVSGQLHLVNVLPGGKADPNATFGGESEGSENGPDLSHVISTDGSRAFWTDLNTTGPNTNHLYVRENDTQPTEECATPQSPTRACTVPVSLGEAKFWTATPDGRYAFYTENEELWRFDTQQGTREALAGGGAQVQGVIGANEAGEDGAYVYFVANGALTNHKNAEGKEPTPGQPNLYLHHNGEPEPTFIATLLEPHGEQGTGDNNLRGPGTGSYGDWQANLGARTAQVTPDGGHLVFMSLRALTGYENRASATAAAVPEVFVYDKATGRLSCASCNPSGAPPTEKLSSADLQLYALGSFLPTSGRMTYTMRWISADGSRVFFETGQPLVPADINGREDVYEWERSGAGSCRQSAGCTYLLSAGNNPVDSTLVDASASGGDVFFTTRAQLLPSDHTGDQKLYDAHECTEAAPCAHATSLACEGTGCQGVPPAPPSFATPSSVTFNGTGNYPPPPSPKGKTAAQIRAELLAKALKACRKKYNKHNRAVCEGQAKKRYGPAHKAKKATRAHKGRRG